MKSVKLSSRILIVILILSILPLLLVGYISLEEIKSVGMNTVIHASEIEAASTETTKIVENLGKEAIRQKAQDVARQVEIYIKAHSDMTVWDLQNDSEFQRIAVQPVGKTGYTALTDYDTLICRFHSNPKIVNVDLITLAQALPGFWAIMSRTKGGLDADGFYDWKDPDGKIRSKYMYITIINATTADGVDMHVAATTYIDEFSLPTEEIKKTLDTHRQNMISQNEKTLSETGYLIIAIIFICIIVIVVSGILLTSSVVKPITSFTKNVEEISSGNLDVKIKLKSYHEIEELSESFNRMVEELNTSRKKIQHHQEELEKQVTGKTSELKEKVDELEKNRSAVLNMMEDSEEANRQLRKAQEGLKKAMEELRKTDVKKDEFISITAHEFKTPLTAIHGFAQLLQGKKIDRESMQKYLRIMMEETDRLAKLVTEILDLSRMDLGTFKFNFEAADLTKLVDDVSNEIKGVAGKKGLKLRYSISPGVPKQIATDPERLRQVLINLVINSVKYTPKGSIELKVAKEHGELKFSVKDTGIGIPKEEIPKLFQRFYQIDSSYTRETKGSGLGLALCKEIVQGMGGKIWLESKAGRGSTFSFTLPFKPKINRNQANKL